MLTVLSVNMKINDISRNIEVSRELEIINFRVLRENVLGYGVEDRTRVSNHWILEERKTNNKNKVKNQFTCFQKSMKVLIVWGQLVGLNPVSGILQKDIKKMRLSLFSFKFLYTMTMALLQTTATGLCIYRLIAASSTIAELGFVMFFLNTTCTTVLFIRIAYKWPTLLKEISNSKLDEYIDPTVIKKCNLLCVTYIGTGVVEHVLSILSKSAKILDCHVNVTDFTEDYVKTTSPWLYDLGVPYNPAVATLTLFINTSATITWNYSNMFIVCMSLYLTSILKQISKKIIRAADKNYLPTSIWQVLRQDYTRATRLVGLFDDVFSSIILVTFANDLFFVCQQLFYILAKGLKTAGTLAKLCPNYPSGLLKGYEYYLYLTYSTIFLIVRFLAVSLIAADVNTAAMEPTAALYRIPTAAYTQEVERFLHQLNRNSASVAFSGLRFFYITRELVLSVAGTIVTYELVLLQFSNEE